MVTQQGSKHVRHAHVGMFGGGGCSRRWKGGGSHLMF